MLPLSTSHLLTKRMKQESSSPITRERVGRTRDKPKMESPSSFLPGSKPRLKSSLVGNGMQCVEKYARVRPSVTEPSNGERHRKVVGDGLSSVKDLQKEVSVLKAQLEKMQSVNLALESQNKQLSKDLSAAEEKIRDLERKAKVDTTRKEAEEFKDVRELIGNKLDLFRGKKENVKESRATKIQSVAPEPVCNHVSFQTPPLPPSRSMSLTGPPTPPPPPPPPRNVPLKTNTMQRPTSLVNFYHSLTKKDTVASGNCSSPVVNNAHNSIVDELQNRSSHLLAIKADVEKKGDFINSLIEKVQSAAFADIEDVLSFVDWLDKQLSVLADERAVLKHFKWPERKADALREAAFEYRDLKKLHSEVSSCEDDVSVPCEASLKKIAALLDKSERSIQRLIKLRDTNKVSYSNCKIPTDWMLDSGVVTKIKMASVKLAKIYMKRVSTELELARQLEKESVQEALLYQGVHFAYRVYQFAGGLDYETMRAFEDLKERAQLYRRGSKHLIHATTLP